MLQVLDLSRDLPCLQAGLAEATAVDQPLDLLVEDPNLVVFFTQLITQCAVMDDLCQGAPVVESGNFFSEDVEGGGRPHE